MIANSSRSRYCPVLLCALLLGCNNNGPTATDGETHFLRACLPEDGSCGLGLDCVCGVCTRLCAESMACEELSPDAYCLPAVDGPFADGCSEISVSALCDVACTSDDSCAALSASHRCIDGFCRVSSDTGANAGGAGGSGPADACPAGDVPGNAVLVLGDAFIAESHRMTAHLETLAREAGALAGSERYRDNSSILGNSLALEGNTIADQYANGQAEGPVRVVIMDGGGADVLLGACDSPPTADCPIVVNAVAAANELLAQMAQDAVEDVIWFFYPNPSDSALRAKVDLLRPLLQGACESSPVPCHWVDLREAFAGSSGYLATDTIPTDTGSEATAEAIWSTMQSNCVAQ